MDIQVNSLNYNFTNGSIDSAQVGLFGRDATSNDYVNAQIKVNQSDLAEGATFLTASMADIVAIAKKKLAADTAVKDATTTPQA
ncbi:hypothetical protein ACLOA0_07885 [Limosilactobacillus fermentum]|uniref:hypothetical protein n=1 Tax=Limosilactobacillus fermentum TaxID=1613 RepID=UPI003EBAAE37